MKKKLIIALGALALLAVAFLVYSHFENTVIEVTRYTVKSERLPSEFDGYKIAQVSDLHSASFGKSNEKLIKKLKSASPDIIVVTGDICDSDKNNDISIAIAFIEEAVKLAPVYYITGNHEASLDRYDELISRIEALGAAVLNDEVAVITKGETRINLIGISDPRFLTKDIDEEKGVVKEKLDALSWDEASYTVLLSHRPEMLSVYSKYDIDLVFTGHAHGGQIRLPFIGGLYAPRQGVFPKYTSGIHEKNGTEMIISRGLGSSVFPFRVNNNPELIIVTLKSQ